MAKKKAKTKKHRFWCPKGTESCKGRGINHKCKGDRNLILVAAVTDLDAERERREAAEADAVEDAANAELQLQGALAAQKQAEERADKLEAQLRLKMDRVQQAEERAAVLAEAMRKMRSGGLVPTFWVQFADDAIAAYETALASRPADERGEERSK